MTRDSRQFELPFEFHSLRVRSREGTNPRFGRRRENTLMHMRRFLPVFAAVLVFGLNQSLSAQRGEWIHLGDKHVDGHADHDNISIGSSEGTFRQLQIRVRRPPSPLSASSFTSEMARMKNCSFAKQSGRVARRVRWTCAAPTG